MRDVARYGILGLRSALVPVTSVGSNLSYLFILVGFLCRSQERILYAALLFALAVVLSLVTLFVEWNASVRAQAAMVAAGLVSEQEQFEAGRALNAAFLSYVAAAVAAVLTLLYCLFRVGVLGGGDD